MDLENRVPALDSSKFSEQTDKPPLTRKENKSEMLDTTLKMFPLNTVGQRNKRSFQEAVILSNQRGN